MASERAAPRRVVLVGARDVDAVAAVVGALPAHSGLAVVVACDCDEVVPAVRAKATASVIEVTERVQIAADHVYLVPRDREARFEHDTLVVRDPRAGRAVLDVLLRSAANAFGRASIALILAGDGEDGALGIKRIKEVCGLTIAQHVPDLPAGMPTAAIATGCIDLVLALDRIGPQLVALLAEEDRPSGDDERREEAAADTLRDILNLVRVRSGHDFSMYKRGTLFRRIARRMQVCDCVSILAYHQLLRDRPAELAHLLRDVLISVTSFFRDPEVFESIEREVIPKLFASKASGEAVRVWTAGCASGEEAYSLGILLLEHASQLRMRPAIQIFATDIDERALAEARLGVYPATAPADLSPRWLERYFTRENGSLRVTRELRELVLFSPHNVLRDPPFSRLDLVACRNLLIYLNREAHHRVLTMFHFGLRPEGFLVLGTSESTESSSMFGSLEAKCRIYTRRAGPASLGESLASSSRWASAIGSSGDAASRSVRAGELHHRAVEQYAPPSVLVDSELEIVHVSEHAGGFLQVSGGAPTRQVLRLCHPALQSDLRSAIYAARQQQVASRLVRFEDGGRARAVELRVRSVDQPGLGAGALLVMFEEQLAGEAPGGHSRLDATVDPVMHELENELVRTREQLRGTIERYESSLEELNASNEELQVMNEELRSMTEQLATSKEELQSVNQELTTLNHELKLGVDEVSHTSSDLQNLMASSEIAVVFLDRALNLKRFTPRARDLFNVIASDIGRPLAQITHQLETGELPDIARSVLQSLHVVEREVRTRDGGRYFARCLPYRSIDERIEGVVLTFVDIAELRDAVDARERSEQALARVEERLRVALRAAPIAILSFDRTGRPVWGYTMGVELSGGELDDLSMFAGGHAERLHEVVTTVSGQRAGQRIELAIVVEGVIRTYDFRVEPTASGATAVGFDITPSKLAAAALRDADRKKDELLATLSHELRNPLAPLQVAIDVAKLVEIDPVKRSQTFWIMERQVAMLSRLVDELLELSRITQGEVELERGPVELARILESAIEATRPTIDAAGQELRIQLSGRSAFVDGDAQRLEQVFTNLLSNATKFTPSEGHIDVDVALTHDRAVIRIADDGVGIDPESLPHIFEIFVPSRDEHGLARGGLGIGLNVVRHLVELHGGTVAALSEGRGRGSAFVVELPITKD
jgi:two-component system CheB/CheR fusion protein